MVIDINEKKIAKSGLTLEEYLILNVVIDKPDITTPCQSTVDILEDLEEKGFLRIIAGEVFINPSARALLNYKYIMEIDEVLEHLNYLKKENNLGNRKFKASAHSKIIRSRLAEKDYGVEEIKEMLTMKFKNWLGTEWERFLGPATLFAKKNFYKYMDEVDYEDAIKEKKSDLFEVMKDGE